MTTQVILTVDTAAEEATVSLLRGGSVMGIESWPNSVHTGTKLLAAIEKLLIANSLKIEDVDDIQVKKGPGGFSSLRAGILTAEILRTFTRPSNGKTVEN